MRMAVAEVGDETQRLPEQLASGGRIHGHKTRSARVGQQVLGDRSPDPLSAK